MRCRVASEAIRQGQRVEAFVPALLLGLVLVSLPGVVECAEPAFEEYADFPELRGPYLGQTPPTDGAEVFAPG